MKYLLQVPDMSCEHCKKRIETVVGDHPEVRSIEVDLPHKRVSVETDLDQSVVIDLIDQAGYDANILSAV